MIPHFVECEMLASCHYYLLGLKTTLDMLVIVKLTEVKNLQWMVILPMMLNKCPAWLFCFSLSMNYCFSFFSLGLWYVNDGLTARLMFLWLIRFMERGCRLGLLPILAIFRYVPHSTWLA